MPRVLVIDSHPDPASLTAQLAASYAAGASDDAVTLVLRDLDFDLTLRTGYRTRQDLEPDLARAQGGVSTALGAIAGQASGATAGLNAEAQAASNAAAEHTRLNVARAAGSSTPAHARTIVADAGSDPTAAISAQRAEMGAYMASVREIQAVDARLRADILADNARVAAGTPRDDGEVARIEGVRRAYATLGAGLQALSGYQSTVTQGLIAQGQAAAEAAQEHARLNSTLNTAPAPRPDQGAVPLDPLPDAEARTALVAAYATQLDRLAARLGPLAAASDQYAARLGDESAAQRAGTLSAQQAAAEMERLSAIYAAAVRPLDLAGDGIADLARNMGLVSSAVVEATRLQDRFNDVVGEMPAAVAPVRQQVTAPDSVLDIPCRRSPPNWTPRSRRLNAWPPASPPRSRRRSSIPQALRTCTRSSTPAPWATRKLKRRLSR